MFFAQALAMYSFLEIVNLLKAVAQRPIHILIVKIIHSEIAGGVCNALLTELWVAIAIVAML